jgi:hypothetical protein
MFYRIQQIANDHPVQEETIEGVGHGLIEKSPVQQGPAHLAPSRPGEKLSKLKAETSTNTSKSTSPASPRTGMTKLIGISNKLSLSQE